MVIDVGRPFEWQPPRYGVPARSVRLRVPASTMAQRVTLSVEGLRGTQFRASSCGCAFGGPNPNPVIVTEVADSNPLQTETDWDWEKRRHGGTKDKALQ